jgi:hypothetical protein
VAARFPALLLAALVVPAGLAWADLRTGEAAFQAQNYGDAYLQLLPAARAGHARAQFLLGQLSDNGLGPIALDPKEAVRWYRMAASKGSGEAQFALARAYATGRGVKQSADQALVWLTRAADGNFEPAMIDLAQLYDDGRGVPKDQAKATDLIRRAAEAGGPDAQYLYAERLAAGTGVVQDQKQAWTWFQRAAEAGQPAALYKIGRIGMTAPKSLEDTINAYVWISLAAQRATGELKGEAARERGELAKQLTPSDIAIATKRIKAWKPAPRPAAAGS